MTQTQQNQELQPSLYLAPPHDDLAQITPLPHFKGAIYRGSGKLQDKVALVTGGDSGIGRAVAIAYAKEGANVAIAYLDEHDDAQITKQQIEQAGCRCILIPGDLGGEPVCQQTIKSVVDAFGRLDILVNNAGEQHFCNDIREITAEQLERTFRTNIFAMFFLTKAAMPYLTPGSAIINTTSVTAYRGNPWLLDYSATKGAIVSFTRSLSLALVKQGIRVNAVAPGPIWTPLISSTFFEDRNANFGKQVPMERAGYPEELASSYVFLASADSSYMTGQVLHINGGDIVNG
jgi:NAD(P)-dependent dehydrogenase (short-subunit alcohol dehydrogenase family)